MRIMNYMSTDTQAYDKIDARFEDLSNLLIEEKKGALSPRAAVREHVKESARQLALASPAPGTLDHKRMIADGFAIALMLHTDENTAYQVADLFTTIARDLERDATNLKYLTLISKSKELFRDAMNLKATNLPNEVIFESLRAAMIDLGIPAAVLTALVDSYRAEQIKHVDEWRAAHGLPLAGQLFTAKREPVVAAPWQARRYSS